MVSSNIQSSRIRAAIALTVLLPLSLGVGWLVLDSLRIAVTMPVQLNYVDGYTVDDALRLARGEPLYPDPASAPYTVTVYTPVFLAATAALVGLGCDGFVAGRLLVLSSMLGLAAIILWFGYRRTGWVAALVALALLLHPMQWPWSLVIRPDLTAILLSVLAVVVVSGAENRRAVAISATLCVVAVLTKQTAAAAPAAILISLLARDRRGAFLFTTIFGLGTLSAAAALQWASHGQFFFQTVTANVNPFGIGRAVAMYGRFLATGPLFIATLVVMLVATARRRQLSVVAVYALLSLLTAGAVGKTGSSMNYFLEPLVAVALWAAIEFPTDWFIRRHPMRVVIGGVAVLAVLLFSTTSWIHQFKDHRAVRTVLPIHTNLVQTVSAVEGVVVSDDASLLVAAGKPVHYRPFIMAQLAEAGLWDQSPFLRELEEGAVAMVIVRIQPVALHETRYTPAMREVLDRRYRIAFQYQLGAAFVALRPRETPAAIPQTITEDQ
ncbi:MAG: hypothetical protein OQK55_10020 [Thermoanaerobaculales bacterium]|nr:hypothetical protein [Thermoanaerobaculales bacterium]